MPSTIPCTRPAADVNNVGRFSARPVAISVTMLAAAGSRVGSASAIPSTSPVSSDVAALASVPAFSTRNVATLVTMLVASAVSGSTLAVIASTTLCKSPMAAGRIASTSAGSASTTTATAASSISVMVPMFSLKSVSMVPMPSIRASATASPMILTSSGWKPSAKASSMVERASTSSPCMSCASGRNSFTILRRTPSSALDASL